MQLNSAPTYPRDRAVPRHRTAVATGTSDVRSNESADEILSTAPRHSPSCHLLYFGAAAGASSSRVESTGRQQRRSAARATRSAGRLAEERSVAGGQASREPLADDMHEVGCVHGLGDVGGGACVDAALCLVASDFRGDGEDREVPV